jgi:acid phosphatase
VESTLQRARLCEVLEPRRLFSAVPLPRPDHVVVLIEEDHSYNQLFGPPTPDALQIWPVVTPGSLVWDTSLRGLESHSASFTNARSVGNSNLVDYQALFSGLKPRRNEKVPATAPNIASELTAAGLSFGGYAEGLPHTGYTGGSVGYYATAHNPWLPFSNFPRGNSMSFDGFPEQFRKLPTVSYVIPDQTHNMHSGSINEADVWFDSNIKPYADWAMKNNSLLIVTWDESHQVDNQIPTLFYGPMVKPGHYSQLITQNNILRTIEDMYGLAPTGNAANAAPLASIFATGKAISPSKPGKAPAHHITPPRHITHSEAPRSDRAAKPSTPGKTRTPPPQ